MAVTVVDSGNQIPFMGGNANTSAPVADEKKEAEAETETKLDDKAAEPQVDEDGLTADERKQLGAKYDKVIAKRHRLQKEAEEAREEAEAFAQNQYRERRAAETRAAELERQLADLQKPETKETEDQEPSDSDTKYKDNPKLYWQDWAKWTARQELKAERQKEAEEQAAADIEARRRAFVSRINEVAKEIPDFREVTGAADAFVPAHIAQYIEESDTGPKIAYHFAKNPEVLESLKKLSAIKAIAAIGKLEATLSTEPKESQAKSESKPEVKPVEKSRAPEPIATLSGNSGTVHKPLAEMSTRETIEYWAERDKAKVSRRQRH